MRVSIARPKSIFKVDRFLIPYRVYENEGPHVICINGVQQSMAMWQTLVSRFQSDYRIVLFDFPGQGKARTLSGPINVSLDEQVQILQAVMDEVEVRAFYEHGLFVISSKRLSDLVDLKKIKAKTFLVNGEKDAIIDSEDVKFLASQIPGCEVRILKGVGHFLHMEREDVVDAYADILAF